MSSPLPESELTALIEALDDLRDSWTLIAIALKDQLTELPSTRRNEVMLQVERQLARIRDGQLGSSE